MRWTADVADAHFDYSRGTAVAGSGGTWSHQGAARAAKPCAKRPAQEQAAAARHANGRQFQDAVGHDQGVKVQKEAVVQGQLCGTGRPAAHAAWFKVRSVWVTTSTVFPPKQHGHTAKGSFPLAMLLKIRNQLTYSNLRHSNRVTWPPGQHNCRRLRDPAYGLSNACAVTNVVSCAVSRE